MARALVGSSGCVGGNLLRQTSWDALYRSANVETIAGRRFELLVCAGARAEKWRINREPTIDRAELARLKRALASASAERLLLVSTVDVYPSPVGVDEETSIDASLLHPYGRHRLELERWATERFPTTVVRLPALFGPGLKKNVVFDFLHGRRLGAIHADSRFQFYDLSQLWADLQLVLAAGWKTINLATEPVAVHELAREAFGFPFEHRPVELAPARYDVRSRFAGHLGGRDGYVRDREAVLAAVRAFVAAEREPAAVCA